MNLLFMYAGVVLMGGGTDTVCLILNRVSIFNKISTITCYF